jgi:hypothetical protein
MSTEWDFDRTLTFGNPEWEAEQQERVRWAIAAGLIKPPGQPETTKPTEQAQPKKSTAHYRSRK